MNAPLLPCAAARATRAAKSMLVPTTPSSLRRDAAPRHAILTTGRR